MSLETKIPPSIQSLFLKSAYPGGNDNKRNKVGNRYQHSSLTIDEEGKESKEIIDPYKHTEIEQSLIKSEKIMKSP